MKLIFLSEKIYEAALRGVIDYLVNLETLYERRKRISPYYRPDPGIVFIDRQKPFETVPEELVNAIKNPKRPVQYKKLPLRRFLEIKTHSVPERSSKVVAYSSKFQFTTHSRNGDWCFGFGSDQISFYGRRNSFAWGRNALFSYEPEDIEVVITFQTSAPEKPFIFKGLLIPDLRPATETELQAANLSLQTQ